MNAIEQGDVSEPAVEYASLPINIGTSGSTGPSSPVLNIHPTSNAAKCVGIKGGIYANGTPVDVYVPCPSFLSSSQLRDLQI